MNRRGFLGGLAGLAAGMVLDPEKLLWTPGQKKIFIPSAPKMGIDLAKPSAERTVVGVRLFNGEVVFADEVFMATNDPTIAINRTDPYASGSYVEARYQAIQWRDPNRAPNFPQGEWIQTYGYSKVKAIEDYSPSLAT